MSRIIGRSTVFSFRVHADHRRILISLASVASYALIAKGCGAAKEIAVAGRFGTGAIADAYAFTFNLLNVPVFVWQQVLISVLVPVLLQNNNVQASKLFRREMFGLTLVVGLVIAIAEALIMLLAISMGWIPLAANVKGLALSMTLVLATTVPLGMASGYLAATMMSGARLLNSLFDGIPPLILLFVILLRSSPGPDWLVWGTVLGYIVQLVISVCAQPSNRRVETPTIGFRAPIWPTFTRFLLYATAGQIIASVSNTVLDQVMVAPLGASANAVLGYANRLSALVLAVGSLAIARATLPIFSDAEGSDREHQGRLAIRWTLLIFIAGVAATAIGWLAAPWGVRVLFKRGAFSLNDVVSVAGALRFSLLQMPFSFATAVIMQLMASRGRFGFFLWMNVAQLVVKLAANMLLIPLFGVQGATMATSIRAAVGFVITLVYLRKVLQGRVPARNGSATT